jgi:HK97 family phage major capsid protein
MPRNETRYATVKKFFRAETFEKRAIEEDAQDYVIELSFSSETPIERWGIYETLVHESGAVNLDRLNNSAAVLLNHDPDQQIGVVEKAWIDQESKKGRAKVRFSRSALAQEIWQDIQDGIRTLVSVGFFMDKKEWVDETPTTSESVRIVGWTPFEISIVSIPADTSVGIGRSLGLEDTPEQTTEVIEESDAREVVEDEEEPEEEAPEAEEPESQNPETEIRNVYMEIGDAIKADAGRRAHIRSIAQKWPGLWSQDEVDGAIDSMVDANEFNVRSLDKLAERGTKGVEAAADPSIGLGSREVGEYSFRRLMLGMQEGNVRSAAPFEWECHEAALKKTDPRSAAQRSASGDFVRIPYDVLASKQHGKRSMSAGTSSAGGNLIATDLLASSLIEELREALVYQSMGATILDGLNGNIAIPRKTGHANYYWIAENGSATESAGTIDQITLSPKTVAAYTDYSRQLLLQSSISVEQFIRSDLIQGIAHGIQDAVINGTGSSNQPTGILNTSGIGAVVGGANGAAPTYTHVVQLEGAVAAANAEPGSGDGVSPGGNMYYLTNTKVRQVLKLTQKFSGAYSEAVWGDGNIINGSPCVITNGVPSNLTKGSASGICSAIIYGNFKDLLIGLWGALDLIYNPYINSPTGKKRFEIYQSVDLNVRHPVSFAAMKDALA